jgi:hypothetical protein
MFVDGRVSRQRWEEECKVGDPTVNAEEPVSLYDQGYLLDYRRKTYQYWGHLTRN